MLMNVDYLIIVKDALIIMMIYKLYIVVMYLNFLLGKLLIRADRFSSVNNQGVDDPDAGYQGQNCDSWLQLVNCYLSCTNLLHCNTSVHYKS